MKHIDQILKDACEKRDILTSDNSLSVLTQHVKYGQHTFKDIVEGNKRHYENLVAFHRS